MQNLNAEYPYDLESAVLNIKYFTKCYLAISQCDMYSVIHMPVIKQANLVRIDLSSWFLLRIRYYISITLDNSSIISYVNISRLPNCPLLDSSHLCVSNFLFLTNNKQTRMFLGARGSV